MVILQSSKCKIINGVLSALSFREGCVYVAKASFCDTTKSALYLVSPRITIRSSIFLRCKNPKGTGGGINVDAQEGDNFKLRDTCFDLCSSSSYGPTFCVWKSSDRFIRFDSYLGQISCSRSQAIPGCIGYAFMFMGGMTKLNFLNSSHNQLPLVAGFRFGNCGEFPSNISFSLVLSNNRTSTLDAYAVIAIGMGSADPVRVSSTTIMRQVIIAENQDPNQVISTHGGEIELHECMFRQNMPTKLLLATMSLYDCYFDDEYQLYVKTAENIHLKETTEIVLDINPYDECNGITWKKRHSSKLFSIFLISLVMS